MQDDLDNVTRFLMLAREPIIPRVDRPFKVAWRVFTISVVQGFVELLHTASVIEESSLCHETFSTETL